MNDPTICPCENFDFPKLNFSAPGLSAFDYRVGDFTAFRHSLLLSLPGETQLKAWRPGASGDLAVQMIEWWACLADILTFYSDRIANESFLGTATSDEAVRGLIRILGYRPRPGIGSTGRVGVVLDGKKPVTIPQGFQIQSKPKPGGQPQMFEVDDATVLTPPLSYTVIAPSEGKLFDADRTLRLKGTIDSIKKDDELLLVKRHWGGTEGTYAVVTVEAVEPLTDALGEPYTKVSFQDPPNDMDNSKAENYRLMRNLQFSPIWHFGTDPDDTQVQNRTKLHLVNTARSIRVGDLVLAKVDGDWELDQVLKNNEVIWYLNDPDDPTKAPTGQDDIPLVAQHSRLTLIYGITSSWNSTGAVLFDWRDVGLILPQPTESLTATSATLQSVSGTFPEIQDQDVVLEDPDGVGTAGSASAANGSTQIEVSDMANPPLTLSMPVSLHLGTVAISRGETVRDEIVGSGNAALENQEFTLKKSPVTYLAGDSVSGDGYRSTIQLWVDGIQWQEVSTLYDQPADAQVFVTWEDDEQKTHIRFGSRLPTGTDNIVATYRIGSGSETPDPGEISIIVKPLENLRKVVSAASLTSGSDPDPAEQIRKYAPRSVLTFGRAVSGDDYEVIAAQAPGVTRARAYWQWDPKSQRGTVALYVGDDDGAVLSARSAIAAASDPNKRVEVFKAAEVKLGIMLTLIVDPRRKQEDVLAAVRTALLDEDSGLFGTNAVRIGQIFWDSDIYSTCIGVPGVVAVHGLKVQIGNKWKAYKKWKAGKFVPNPKHDPGEGKYFTLNEDRLSVSAEVATDVA